MANFCGNCGSPLKEGYKFCENCGAPVEESVSAVGNLNADTTAKESMAAVGSSNIDVSVKESVDGATGVAFGAAAAGVVAGRESAESPDITVQPQENVPPRPEPTASRNDSEPMEEAFTRNKAAGPAPGLPAREPGSNSNFQSYGNPTGSGTGQRYEPDTDLKSMYLRYDNRLNRKPYIIRSFHIWAVVVGLTFVVGTIATMLKIPSINMLSKVISFAAAIPNFMLLIRRLHDLNRSGWWALIMLIPLVNLLFAVYVIFFKGTKGPNKYGPDPLG